MPDAASSAATWACPALTGGHLRRGSPRVRIEYGNTDSCDGSGGAQVSCSYVSEVKPLGSQSWDWQEKQRRLVWKFTKAAGGTEHTLQARHLPPPPPLPPKLRGTSALRTYGLPLVAALGLHTSALPSSRRDVATGSE